MDEDAQLGIVESMPQRMLRYGSQGGKIRLWFY